MRHVISALVMNEPGVLSLVSGLFSARGFNIASLVVGLLILILFPEITLFLPRRAGLVR